MAALSWRGDPHEMQHTSERAVRIGLGPRVRGETMLGETQTGWTALHRHSWRKQRRISRGQEGGELF